MDLRSICRWGETKKVEYGRGESSKHHTKPGKILGYNESEEQQRTFATSASFTKWYI